jgi:hypothetical protein
LRFHADKVIQDSAWDRIAQFEVLLQRATVPEARRIVAARLARFFAPFGTLTPVQQQIAQDPLFPLGRPWADAFLGDKIDVRPRGVINAAREGWRREQETLRRLGGETWLANWGEVRSPPGEEEKPAPTTVDIQREVDLRVAQKVAEQKTRRHREPHTLPADAAQLAGLVFSLLKQCQRSGAGFHLAGVDWCWIAFDT